VLLVMTEATINLSPPDEQDKWPNFVTYQTSGERK